VIEQSALYVCEAYKDLYKFVTDPDPDRRFLITGILDVGKSCFLLYLLIQLLYNVDDDDVTVIYHL